MAGHDALHVVQAWHDAVNIGDVDSAVQLCSADVAVTGPRGVGHGHEMVRGWLVRSGIGLEPQGELFEVDGRFVVQELARWTTTDAPADAPTEPTPTWCVFTVASGLITSIARFETEDDVPPVA